MDHLPQLGFRYRVDDKTHSNRNQPEIQETSHHIAFPKPNFNIISNPHFFKSKCLSRKTFFRLISVHSFASLDHERPRRGSGNYTPPSDREGHGSGHVVLLVTDIVRLAQAFLGETLSRSGPLLKPNIPQRLARDKTRTYVIKGRRLTA